MVLTYCAEHRIFQKEGVLLSFLYLCDNALQEQKKVKHTKVYAILVLPYWLQQGPLLLLCITRILSALYYLLVRLIGKAYWEQSTRDDICGFQ